MYAHLFAWAYSKKQRYYFQSLQKIATQKQMPPQVFQQALLAWFDHYGRKDLPWQQTVTPYRVWVSEIMLQQTQVTSVIPYFQRFMQSFPEIESLANASLDAVLQHWAGLGYYARARNLHKTAQIIVREGQFPQTLNELSALPGIGLSTAGAILSLAFQQATPILDGNVRRVLARFCAIEGWTGKAEVNQRLWAMSEFYTPKQRVADYTQAMMDLGATVCTRKQPLCAVCPLAAHCLAKLHNKTAFLPTPKTTKKNPIKSVVFLCVENAQQQVLLYQRPASGIWGGLWSLPEFTDIAAAQAWCDTHHLKRVREEILTEQRHTFTHYHLDYTPLRIFSDSQANPKLDGRAFFWYNGAQIFTLALPAPILRLLQVFYQEIE